MNKPTADELETLENQTNVITANLKEIADDPMTEDDLDSLQEQTNTIAWNLKTIGDDETDLDELEAQLDRIIAKLKQVKEEV
jgi:hypothetical protein